MHTDEQENIKERAKLHGYMENYITLLEQQMHYFLKQKPTVGSKKKFRWKTTVDSLPKENQVVKLWREQIRRGGK